MILTRMFRTGAKCSTFRSICLSGAARITFIYVIFGCIWIIFSDRVLARLFPDLGAFEQMQTIKGWLFVLVTAALLYVLISRHIALIEHQRRQLKDSYERTLAGWVRALDLRDRETEEHTQRVTELTVALAHRMGLDADIEHIRRGALLHDIGKMGVPDAILNKPGPLTLEEWDVMRRHPEYAREWLESVPFLRPALDIPYCHHEHWDGTGYPRGLREDDIPLPARLFAVADAWDALTRDRPYRQALPPQVAAAYLRAHAGSHFDPEVVECFLRLVLEQDGAAGGSVELETIIKS
ncbi:MAG: hypothetical protein Kow0059_02010 [Candidatus Sumerlaeia bacterium]